LIRCWMPFLRYSLHHYRKR